MAFGLSCRAIATSQKRDVHEILGAKDAQKNNKKFFCGICFLFLFWFVLGGTERKREDSPCQTTISSHEK
jgi:hypothetical protein